MSRSREFTLRADVSGFGEAMNDLERSAGRVGRALTGAFEKAAVEGRAFDDVLRQLALRLASIALDSALKPLERGASDLFAGLAGALGNALAGGRGDAVPERVSAPTITMNVSTPDAQSFRRSEGQIAAMVARSAMRGRRSL